MIAIVEDDSGNPLDVGRKTRSIPPAIRRALKARDRGCRFHHRCVHEGGVSIQALDDGALRFVTGNGEHLETVAPRRREAHIDWTHLAATHRACGIHIDPQTAVPRWRGERIDYGLAIDVLLQHAKRARNVSAET